MKLFASAGLHDTFFESLSMIDAAHSVFRPCIEKADVSSVVKVKDSPTVRFNAY